MVGPGRLERSYRARVRTLEEELQEGLGKSAAALAAARRELETARLVERGSGRLLDRLETDLERTRERGRRLLVAMGAMQRENEELREALSLSMARALAPPPRRGWLRWLGRRT